MKKKRNNRATDHSDLNGLIMTLRKSYVQNSGEKFFEEITRKNLERSLARSTGQNSRKISLGRSSLKELWTFTYTLTLLKTFVVLRSLFLIKRIWNIILENDFSNVIERFFCTLKPKANNTWKRNLKKNFKMDNSCINMSSSWLTKLKIYWWRL